MGVPSVLHISFQLQLNLCCQVDWQKGDALQPETFAHLFPEVDGVVHTLGTLIENSDYKQAIKQGDILGLLGSVRDSIIGNHGNPLERPTVETLRGSYDALNRDSGAFPGHSCRRDSHYST